MISVTVDADVAVEYEFTELFELKFCVIIGCEFLKKKGTLFW